MTGKVKRISPESIIIGSVWPDSIIALQPLDIIFQRFRQVYKTFTRNREGSGIGLSIVKALVEMHNGAIWVESQYERGSKFTVELPDVQLEEEEEDTLYSEFEDRIQERIKIELSDL
jgi:light-regulated signal transduction histidine kinase (bacteriophytochrome)